ncbi:hypothetical protein UC77_09105 [Clostridium baratii]|nr:hypothetical protein NPD11_3045 [Clostridium baratii]KJU71561.1 hypothetical protein UC77_09105 [Clostridium baratii]
MYKHLNSSEKSILRDNLLTLILMKKYHKMNKDCLIFSSYFKMICEIYKLYKIFDFNIDKNIVLKFIEEDPNNFNEKFFEFFYSDISYEIPDIVDYMSKKFNFIYDWTSCDMILTALREGYTNELSDYVCIDIPEDEDTFVDAYGENPYVISLNNIKLPDNYLNILKAIYNPYSYYDNPYFFDRDRTILLLLDENTCENEELMRLFLVLLIFFVEKQVA